MAGVVAGPRGVDGNAVGIAYNCDLYNYRAVHDVLITTDLEKIAVADAIITAAFFTENAKIISMSISQLPFHQSPAIKLGLDFAEQKGLIVFCAAGTGADVPLTDLLFPANYPSTYAVTGIRAPVSWPGALTTDDDECGMCFTGGAVDFVTIMEKAIVVNVNETEWIGPITVDCSSNDPNYTGGSSAATSSMAGMAALVWSKYPDEYKPDIIARLVGASSNPGGIPGLGHGSVNVHAALQ